LDITDSQLNLIVQVIRDHELAKLRAKSDFDKKGSAVKREWSWTEITQPELSSVNNAALAPAHSDSRTV
jgi:hypothetical protein